MDRDAYLMLLNKQDKKPRKYRNRKIKDTRKESDIKREIVKYLRARGHFPIPYRNVGIKKKDGSYIPSQMLGVADLIGITKQGKFFCVEVKRQGNKTTALQEIFLKTVRSFGCIGIVGYSFKDCEKAGL